MPLWPALLLSPALALASQSLAYALSSPACAAQREAWMHVVPGSFMLMTLAFTAMAWAALRSSRAGAGGSPDADAAPTRRHFLAWVAVGCGALSTLAILAMWIPQWMLSPCVA
jgi:hypothetical protein